MGPGLGVEVIVGYANLEGGGKLSIPRYADGPQCSTWPS